MIHSDDPQECHAAREPHERTLAQLYDAIDGWMAHYREACPDDSREDLDSLLDETVSHATSPYWPLDKDEPHTAGERGRETMDAIRDTPRGCPCPMP